MTSGGMGAKGLVNLVVHSWLTQLETLFERKHSAMTKFMRAKNRNVHFHGSSSPTNQNDLHTPIVSSNFREEMGLDKINTMPPYPDKYLK